MDTTCCLREGLISLSLSLLPHMRNQWLEKRQENHIGEFLYSFKTIEHNATVTEDHICCTHQTYGMCTIKLYVCVLAPLECVHLRVYYPLALNAKLHTPLSLSFSWRENVNGRKGKNYFSYFVLYVWFKIDILALCQTYSTSSIRDSHSTIIWEGNSGIHIYSM